MCIFGTKSPFAAWKMKWKLLMRTTYLYMDSISNVVHYSSKCKVWGHVWPILPQPFQRLEGVISSVWSVFSPVYCTLWKAAISRQVPQVCCKSLCVLTTKCVHTQLEGVNHIFQWELGRYYLHIFLRSYCSFYLSEQCRDIAFYCRFRCIIAVHTKMSLSWSQSHKMCKGHKPFSNSSP